MRGLVSILYLFQWTGICSSMSSSIPLTSKRCIAGLLSPILAVLVRFALAHPELKALALTCVYRYPALESWLCGFAVAKGITGSVMVQTYSELSSLTPNALCIYADLKNAVERHNRDDQ